MPACAATYGVNGMDGAGRRAWSASRRPVKTPALLLVCLRPCRLGCLLAGGLGLDEGGDPVVQLADAVEAVFALLAVTRAVLPVMRVAGKGTIVNLSSIGSFASAPGWGIYASTKFAIEGFTDALRDEVAPLGITAGVVEPGYFSTDFLDGSSLHVSRPIGALVRTMVVVVPGVLGEHLPLMLLAEDQHVVLALAAQLRSVCGGDSFEERAERRGRTPEQVT